MSFHKHHPSALVYLDALGPADGITRHVERFYLLDAVFTTDLFEKPLVRLAMQATALEPPPKHMFIEIEQRLLDATNKCFVKEPLWLEDLLNVYRSAADEALDISEPDNDNR